MYRILTMILFFTSIHLISAQKEMSIKLHFDGNLGLEIEREVAPKLSVVLEPTFSINSNRAFSCQNDSLFNTFTLFDSIFLTAPSYDVFTLSLGGRYYLFPTDGNDGVFTGLSLNYELSKLRSEEESDWENYFFVDIPFGYKRRFGKRYLIEVGFTTSILKVNNEICENHENWELNGSYFLRLGYQITKKNQYEKESINPATK